MKIDIFKSVVKLFLPSRISKHDINIDKINNILIMSNTAIGDTLFATPAIKVLKEKYPGKKIIALLNPSNVELFKNNKYIDKVYTYNGKWKGFIKTIYSLKKEKIDISFIFHSNEPQATPLAYFIGSKYIIKIPNDKNEFNYLHYNEIEKQKNEHATLSRLKQLDYLNINNTSNQSMEIFLEEDWKREVSDFLSSFEIKDNVIGIQIGASTISRMWFSDRWISLIDKILKYDKEITIILTGAPNENKIVNDVYKKFVKNKNVINASGQLSLCGAAALIGRFNLFITPDTGPLHIAASQKINTLALYVAGNPLGTNPNSNCTRIIHAFIQKNKTCTPCKDKKCQYQECMLQIETEEVFNLYQQIMKKISSFD